MFSIIHHSKNPSNTFLRISLSHRSSSIWSCLHVSTSQPSSSCTRYSTNHTSRNRNEMVWTMVPDFLIQYFTHYQTSPLPNLLLISPSPPQHSPFPLTHEWHTLTFLKVNPNPFVRTAPNPSLFHTFCYLAHSTLTADPSLTYHSHSNPYYSTNLLSINLSFHFSTPPTYCSKFNPKTALLAYAVVHGAVYKIS